MTTDSLTSPEMLPVVPYLNPTLSLRCGKDLVTFGESLGLLHLLEEVNDIKTPPAFRLTSICQCKLTRGKAEGKTKRRFSCSGGRSVLIKGDRKEVRKEGGVKEEETEEG